MKRNREHTNMRRWTHKECTDLLKYSLEYIDVFEKPTALIFYQKLIEKNPAFRKFEAETIRQKMKNLRATYKKAICWKNAGEEISGKQSQESIHENLIRLCPFWDTLDIIHKHRILNQQNEISTIRLEDDTSSRTPSELEIHIKNEIEENHNDDDDNKTFVDNVNNHFKKSKISKTSALLEIIKGHIDYNEKKLKLDEKKLQFEEKKFEEEFALKKIEIETRKLEAENKKLEIQSNERIRMFEIEMKYKCKADS